MSEPRDGPRGSSAANGFACSRAAFPLLATKNARPDELSVATLRGRVQNVRAMKTGGMGRRRWGC